MWRRISAAAAVSAALAACVSLSGYTGGTKDADAGAVVSLSDASDSGENTATCTADVQTDSKNCGACGHDCLGGQCIGGACQVLVLRDDFTHPLGVDVTSTKIYVTDNNGLWEVSLDGSSSVNVVTGTNAHYVVATDTDVYFSSASDSAIHRWPRSGGDGGIVVPNVGGVENVRVSATYMYFTRYVSPDAGGGVYRVTYPGFADLEQVFSYDHPEGLQLRGSELYVGSDHENDVIAVDPDGTQHVLFIGGGPSDFAFDGDALFVAEQAAGFIAETSADGGVATPIESGLANPAGIVATPTALYWVESGGTKLDVLAR